MTDSHRAIAAPLAARSLVIGHRPFVIRHALFLHDEAPPMSITLVQCSLRGCAEPAAYKIAAQWSDGSFSELKSYGFACSDHLGPVFREAEQRRQQYGTSPG